MKTTVLPCCSGRCPQIESDIDAYAQDHCNNGDPHRIRLRLKVSCAITKIHEKRITNAAATNQAQNEEHRMDLAVVGILETALSDRFANGGEFKDVQDDKSNVNGKPAHGSRMPTIPQHKMSP